MNGSEAALVLASESPDVSAPWLTAIEVSADRDRAVDLESGVGDAVVLCGSVGSRLGFFFELPLSGAMMLPTESL